MKEGLAPLGEEYLSLLETGFEGRWIDVYEMKEREAELIPGGFTAAIPMCC